MSNVTVVRTKSELENAIERQNRTIAVQSDSLATDIETIKSASSAAILTASVAIGLSATLLFAIYNDYSINGRTEVRLAGGDLP